jgi:hypothetical protein
VRLVGVGVVGAVAVLEIRTRRWLDVVALVVVRNAFVVAGRSVRVM